MKLLAVADIHQRDNKWKLLVNLCEKEPFDVVAIAGDLFPKGNGIEPQVNFVKHLKKYAQKITKTGAKLVFILGNDDNQNCIYQMEQGHNIDWYYVSEKVVEIDGYEFIGMPYVPDHPFGYKYWCRAEFPNQPKISAYQRSNPLIINSDNEFEEIRDYKAFLLNQPSIWSVLESLAKNVKNIKKSIWLIHAPPFGILDVCAGGKKVGSDAVLKFVEEYQPMLTIHGHIHESPEYNGEIWCWQYNKTLCVQNGQLTEQLYYSVIEIQDDKIISKKHSHCKDYERNY